MCENFAVAVAKLLSLSERYSKLHFYTFSSTKTWAHSWSASNKWPFSRSNYCFKLHACCIL